MKRLFDLFFSSLGLLFLSPVFLIIAVWIKLDSKGSVFYKQERVGRNEKIFCIYKFRSMQTDADKKGLLSLGDKDNRITKSGRFLRKTKLDEIAQLINVWKGEMSFVGPRPEVLKYVNHYTDEQRKILMVKPGITDYASIYYMDEEQLLGASNNPEKTYIEEIMPHKIELNQKYIDNVSVITDIKLIFLTAYKILR